MKILLTGSNGFVGRVLLPLLEECSEVLTISARHDAECSEYIRSEYDDTSLARLIKLYKPDKIIHLAGVMKSESPDAYYRVNCHYAQTILSVARADPKRPQVILIGSAAEYGINYVDSELFREEQDGIPVNYYGISKLAQTKLGLWYQRNGLPVTILRVFNLTGPGQGIEFVLGRVVNYIGQYATQFTSQSSINLPLQTGFLGDQRDFLDVRDFCGLLRNISCMDYKEDYSLLNVCTGSGIKVRDLVEELLLLRDIPYSVVEEKANSNQTPTAIVGSPKKFIQFYGSSLVFDSGRTLRAMLDEVADSDTVTS
ncbi:MAG: hypothetical protein CL398_01885 [Acidiferrobacteraceae bacterium]|nr:hypothetical protein [Acidiferrobacteraceae bacterium]